MKKLLTFFLTLFVASSVWAYDFEVDGIYYDVDEELNSSVRVTYKVPNVEEEYYFYGASSYEGSITIPSSVTYDGKIYNVTSIGDSAFFYCTSLTSVTIPNSVTSIGDWAFRECRALKSVTIPNSVKSIGTMVFKSCYKLTSIQVDKDNQNYCLVDGVLYNKDMTKLIVAHKELGAITIPNSVTCIGDCAFEDCDGLTSVTIPNSVTSIGDYAFYNCSGLKSITIPESVTSIGYEAFSCGSNLQCNIKNGLKFLGNAKNPYLVIVDVVEKYEFSTAIIPEGTKFIANSAFQSCYDLKSVTIPNSVTSIGDRAFDNCDALTSVTIPNSVTSIGDWAFSDCRVLTSVTIPNSVTSIGNYAFSYCDALTSITIPSSVTSIGTGVFTRCYKLTSIQLDKYNQDYCLVDGVLYNKDMTKLIVAHKGELGAITIPNSVTCIEDWAFGDCWGLTSITIPNSVTSIGERTFYKCSGLTSVTIPDGVTSIGNSAFYGCTSLTSVTIPNSVTSIGSNAFESCDALTSITIPSSVTSIGSYAFGGCTSLTRVTNYAVKPQAIESSTFETYNAYLYIPCDNFDAYDLDNNWGNFKHIECVSAEETVVTKDAVSVEPEITEAVFSMPTTTTANSYSLTISNNNVTFCTLTFNNQGQLSNIDFSGNTLKSEIEGYQFTVTGLSASTDYGYSFKALSKSKAVLKEYTGKFTTKAENGIGGSSEGGEYSEGGDKEQNYTITVSSANNAQGTVVGSGSYENGKTATLVAVPSAGYKFVQWNDGNTDNPRTITVTGNATFIATFTENTNTDPQSSYTITAISANNEQGTVVGGGSFAANATTVLAVVPATGYKFVSWNDGNTENPRTITVTGDAFYVATFERISTAINDVEEEMLVTISNRQILVNGEAPAFVITSLGQKVANQNLKAGIYFVQVGNEMQGVAVK